MAGKSQPIVWRLSLAVPREQVYELLSTDEGRARFWAEATRRRGDAIVFRCADGSTHRAWVIEEKPPLRFSLAYQGGIATFRLVKSGKGTRLELAHAGVAAADRAVAEAAWVGILLGLKAAAQFDVDLRNHDRRRSLRQRFVDQ